MLKARYVTTALLLSVALSIAFYVAFTLTYQQFPIGTMNLYELGTYLVAVLQLGPWFCSLFVLSVALLPDFAIRVFRQAKSDYKRRRRERDQCYVVNY